MSKKILGICAALMALAALAVRSLASAATTLRENGTSLAVGTKILATQHEETIFSIGGSAYVCTENKMTGQIHTNDHTNGITVTIERVSFHGSAPETRCESGLLGPIDIPSLDTGGHWCIKNIAGTDEFEMLGRGCTESGNGTITFDSTGNLTCTYTRSEGIRGEFNTTSAPATLRITGEPLLTKESPSALLCPGSLKITKMAFTLFTDNEVETPVSIDNL